MEAARARRERAGGCAQNGLAARRSRPHRQGDARTSHTYKLVELVGSSPTSTDEAIRNAVAKASATVKHIDWFQVIETRGHVDGGKVAHFQVTLKVGFRIEG